jgi:SNF2 family DNA or RNA helicase
LKNNGIHSLTLHGQMSLPKRTEQLETFRHGDRDGARVLLISNVGSVGLNIACANILIIVVRDTGYRVL